MGPPVRTIEDRLAVIANPATDSKLRACLATSEVAFLQFMISGSRFNGKQRESPTSRTYVDQLRFCQAYLASLSPTNTDDCRLTGNPFPPLPAELGGGRRVPFQIQENCPSTVRRIDEQKVSTMKTHLPEVVSSAFIPARKSSNHLPAATGIHSLPEGNSPSTQLLEFPSFVNEFNELRQQGSLSEYQAQFAKLKSLMARFSPALDEEFFISRFISGLEEELRPVLSILQPYIRTLAQTYNRAQWEEDAIAACKLQLDFIGSEERTKTVTAESFLSPNMVDGNGGLVAEKEYIPIATTYSTIKEPGDESAHTGLANANGLTDTFPKGNVSLGYMNSSYYTDASVGIVDSLMETTISSALGVVATGVDFVVGSYLDVPVWWEIHLPADASGDEGVLTSSLLQVSPVIAVDIPSIVSSFTAMGDGFGATKANKVQSPRLESSLLMGSGIVSANSDNSMSHSSTQRDHGYEKQTIVEKMPEFDDIDEQEAVCDSGHEDQSFIDKNHMSPKGTMLQLLEQKSVKVQGKPVEQNHEWSVEAPLCITKGENANRRQHAAAIDDAEYNHRKMVKIKANHKPQSQVDFQAQAEKHELGVNDVFDKVVQSVVSSYSEAVSMVFVHNQGYWWPRVKLRLRDLS